MFHQPEQSERGQRGGEGLLEAGEEARVPEPGVSQGAAWNAWKVRFPEVAGSREQAWRQAVRSQRLPACQPVHGLQHRHLRDPVDRRAMPEVQVPRGEHGHRGHGRHGHLRQQLRAKELQGGFRHLDTCQGLDEV